MMDDCASTDQFLHQDAQQGHVCTPPIPPVQTSLPTRHASIRAFRFIDVFIDLGVWMCVFREKGVMAQREQEREERSIAI